MMNSIRGTTAKIEACDCALSSTVPPTAIASIYASSDASAKLDRILKEDPDVERWSTYVGRGAIRFYLPLNVELPNDFFSQVVAIAKDIAARERLRGKVPRAAGPARPT